MPIRDTDFSSLGAVNIDRKIPLWGILVVVGSVATQGVLVWNGQQLQAQKMDAMALQFRELATDLKDLNTQLSAKSSTDGEQTSRLNDLSRRLIIIESQRENARENRR